MNKTIACLLAIAVALCVAGMIYPATMEIVALDYETDEVYLQNATGYVYVMTGCEDYAVGDLVSLVMFSNATLDIIDDQILSARYSGYYMKGGID